MTVPLVCKTYGIKPYAYQSWRTTKKGKEDREKTRGVYYNDEEDTAYQYEGRVVTLVIYSASDVRESSSYHVYANSDDRDKKSSAIKRE